MYEFRRGRLPNVEVSDRITVHPGARMAYSRERIKDGFTIQVRYARGHGANMPGALHVHGVPVDPDGALVPDGRDRTAVIAGPPGRLWSPFRPAPKDGERWARIAIEGVGGDPVYEGLIDDTVRWNGWQVPLFPHDQVRRMMADFDQVAAQYPDADTLRWATDDPLVVELVSGQYNAAGGALHPGDEPRVERIEPDERGLYGVGAGHWCWFEDTRPMPGDAVRLLGFWLECEPGDIGVIGGYVGKWQAESTITFNASTHRDTYGDDDHELVSCSGGPGTICTDLSELRPTGERVTLRCWRWRDGIVGGGQGEPFTVEVPLFGWLPRGATVPDRPYPPPRRFGPIPTGGATHRGEHPLGYQPRRVEQDWDGRTVAENFGRTALGWRMPAGELAGVGYEFLIYSPRSAGTNWTAFRDRAAMQRWLDAYALTLDHEPEPGSPFTVQLPDDDSGWLPLRTEPDPTTQEG